MAKPADLLQALADAIEHRDPAELREAAAKFKAAAASAAAEVAAQASLDSFAAGAAAKAAAKAAAAAAAEAAAQPDRARTLPPKRRGTVLTQPGTPGPARRGAVAALAPGSAAAAVAESVLEEAREVAVILAEAAQLQKSRQGLNRQRSWHAGELQRTPSGSSMGAVRSEARPRLRRPSSAAVVNMNRVARGRSAPSWTMRGKPTSTVCAGGGLAGTKGAAYRALLAPGPGQYKVVRPEDYLCKRAPSHSLCGQIGGWQFRDGPGPGDYGQTAAVGHRMPEVAFGSEGRFGPEDASRGPGPAKYDVCKPAGCGAPARSFGDARYIPVDLCAPGPTSYAPHAASEPVKGVVTWRPRSAGAPARGRGDYCFGVAHRAGRPGPGDYEAAAAADAVLPRHPAYSLRPATQLPCDDVPFETVAYTQFAG